MLKYSHFSGQTERGISAIPLFGSSDAALEKCASSGLLPGVTRYIENLRPRNDAQYVLVNAMGAGEYYGSNINGDHFPEAGLIHRPDSWTDNPLIDSIKAKTWAYGYPTFYLAHPYAHHRNKDPKRAFGDVELAVWNDGMKRVELVTRIDRDKCMQFGGTGVWDKIKQGQYPDVSMGTKVPYDTCSICLDWEMYKRALGTFDPRKHSHPGQAALAFHKARIAAGKPGIRGLSITRKDYCEHALREMSRIYKDGRKVWVYNDYPRFFDISFVFIGADKTAKVMLFIFRGGQLHSSRSSSEVADTLGVREPGLEKAASVGDEMMTEAFGKLATPKFGEISKNVVPTQFAGKAVPLLTRGEPELSRKLLDGLSALPLAKTLSTTAGMGMVLKPKEFQRLALMQLGKKTLADELDLRGEVFEKSESTDSVDMGSHHFMPALAELLAPFLSTRCGFGPVIEQRVMVINLHSASKSAAPSSHSRELMDKIGAAYNGYRDSLMHVATVIQDALSQYTPEGMYKVASATMQEMFTPLSVAYLQNAHLDAFGVSDGGVVKLSSGICQRGEGFPLEEHVDLEQPINHV